MTFEFNQFRDQYNSLAKQYSLPFFNSLNNDFEIEKISQESITLLRAVRKVMIEKVFNILSFLEMLLNPVNAPRTYLSYIKSMTNEDRKEVEKIYSAFGALTLRALPLEIDYSEKREAEMIKDIQKIWSDAKKDVSKLLEQIAMPVTSLAKKERSYYG